MAFNISELDALRKKLDRDRRELDERERALAKVEEMLREVQDSEQPELPIPAPLPAKADGFTDAVKAAVTALSDREFSTLDIERYLLSTGIEMPKSDPRSRIAMVLQALRTRNAITMVSKGKGREPHTYRAKGVAP